MKYLLKKIKKRIKKTVVLIVFATVSYTVFNTLLMLSNGDLTGLYSYFMRYIDFTNIVKLLSLNIPICLEYFWYLYAILYVYVIFYFVTVFHVKDKVVFIISGSILLLHVLLGEVLSVWGIALPGLIVRNFAVMGISFFGLGLYVKKYQHKFITISNFVISLFLIIGILESILSRYFLGKKEIYIGSLLILIALICVFIKYSAIKYPRFLIVIGGCSTYIYVFHDMVSKSLRATYTMLGLDMNSSVILMNLHPLVVCVISTLVAYLFNKVLGALQRHKKPK